MCVNEDEILEDIELEPHIRYIRKFYLKKFSFPKDIPIDECIEKKKYLIYDAKSSRDFNREYFLNDYVAEFPLIIKSDGTVWDLGNRYFISIMLMDSDISGGNLRSAANDLLDYYRFSESRKIDFFYFPKLDRYRITYQYRNYLLNQVNQGMIATSTASRHINRVIDFYERGFSSGFISEKDFENQPYEIIIKKITLNRSISINIEKNIRSSNLAIKTTQKNKEYDKIYDGGALRPLTEKQLNIFLYYLNKFGNRQLQLMCLISLITGARLQTIGTLRVYHLNKLLKDNMVDEYGKLMLNSGPGTDIDTKKNTPLRLRFPPKLVNQLKRYIESKTWHERALNNYYGATDQGYIFTTKSGLPYYTSKRELFDLKNDPSDEHSSIRTGQAVRKNLEKLLLLIYQDHPDYPRFRFHDLRATFAMNQLNHFLKLGYSRDRIFLKLKNLMGHSDAEDTMKYLDYKEVLNEFSKTQALLEETIFGEMLND